MRVLQRHKFSREIKAEAFLLVRDWGVSVVLGGRELDVHANVHRQMLKEIGSDTEHAFADNGKAGAI